MNLATGAEVIDTAWALGLPRALSYAECLGCQHVMLEQGALRQLAEPQFSLAWEY